MLEHFFENIRKQLQVQEYSTPDKFLQQLSALEHCPLTKDQCVYVMDWKTNEIIFQKGVENLLGYSGAEFTKELVASCFHPEEVDMLERLIRGTVNFTVEHEQLNNDNYLFALTYRLKTKTGKYKKILRQTSILRNSVEGKMLCNVSFLTDISFISSSDMVDWRFEADGLDLSLFQKSIYKEYQGFFSARELEIIQLIEKKYTSKQIAQELFISKFTVDTHRKNILRKCNCSGVNELLFFCKKNGIL